jgi:fibronectin type 3 domain-containing protein
MLKRCRVGQVGTWVTVLSTLGLVLVGCGSDDSPVAGADLTPPEAPTGVSAAVQIAEGNPEYRDVTISWDANVESDLATYEVYWSADGESYEKLISVPSGTLSYQDERAQTEEYAHYKIKAVDESSNESEYSEAAQARVGPVISGGSGKPQVEEPFSEE